MPRPALVGDAHPTNDLPLASSSRPVHLRGSDGTTDRGISREGRSMGDTGFSSGVGRSTRRQFGRAVAGLTAGTVFAPAIVRGRNLNEKLNIAVIGAGGRGGANLRGVSSETIVALCDVSEPAI